MQLIFYWTKTYKTCSICRSVLFHKFIGDPRWSAWCAKLHYTAACCRSICFFVVVFLRVVCLLCCVLFTLIYFCLCAFCFVCVALLEAWLDDLAVPRPITINFKLRTNFDTATRVKFHQVWLDLGKLEYVETFTSAMTLLLRMQSHRASITGTLHRGRSTHSFGRRMSNSVSGHVIQN